MTVTQGHTQEARYHTTTGPPRARKLGTNNELTLCNTECNWKRRPHLLRQAELPIVPHLQGQVPLSKPIPSAPHSAFIILLVVLM